jgi:hypothetical protein
MRLFAAGPVAPSAFAVTPAVTWTIARPTICVLVHRHEAGPVRNGEAIV